MNKKYKISISISFQAEPADRSVGIMKGFAADVENTPWWCNLKFFGKTVEQSQFAWYNNDSELQGKEEAKQDSIKTDLVESLLFAFADAFYEGKI